jgi:hypothetical protein
MPEFRHVIVNVSRRVAVWLTDRRCELPDRFWRGGSKNRKCIHSSSFHIQWECSVKLSLVAFNHFVLVTVPDGIFEVIAALKVSNSLSVQQWAHRPAAYDAREYFLGYAHCLDDVTALHRSDSNN